MTMTMIFSGNADNVEIIIITHFLTIFCDQATALLVGRQIQVVGTNHKKQGGWITLESVAGSVELAPLTIGHYYDHHYQSLAKDEKKTDIEEEERIAEEKVDELTDSLEEKNMELENKDKLLRKQDQALLELKESQREEMNDLKVKLNQSLCKGVDAELFNQEIISTLNPDLVQAVLTSVEQAKRILELEEELKVVDEKEQRRDEPKKDQERVKEKATETLKRLREKPVEDKKTEKAMKLGLNMFNIHTALNLMNASGKRELEKENDIDGDRSAETLKLDENPVEPIVTPNECELEEDGDESEEGDHDEEKERENEEEEKRKAEKRESEENDQSTGKEEGKMGEAIKTEPFILQVDEEVVEGVGGEGPSDVYILEERFGNIKSNVDLRSEEEDLKATEACLEKKRLAALNQQLQAVEPEPISGEKTVKMEERPNEGFIWPSDVIDLTEDDPQEVRMKEDERRSKREGRALRLAVSLAQTKLDVKLGRFPHSEGGGGQD